MSASMATRDCGAEPTGLQSCGASAAGNSMAVLTAAQVMIATSDFPQIKLRLNEPVMSPILYPTLDINETRLEKIVFSLQSGQPRGEKVEIKYRRCPPTHIIESEIKNKTKKVLTLIL